MSRVSRHITQGSFITIPLLSNSSIVGIMPRQAFQNITLNLDRIGSLHTLIQKDVVSIGFSLPSPPSGRYLWILGFDTIFTILTLHAAISLFSLNPVVCWSSSFIRLLHTSHCT
ncbi:uncharacterized protein G2W53_035917 [Senna tora]|uniref:Uncharacterized protein n=1 Tax=Senna tora TaxID=362788 RepID=A0A834T466_9FABA|nr:uncharacterized protein G2W53_035917 [Senna tora]